MFYIVFETKRAYGWFLLLFYFSVFDVKRSHSLFSIVYTDTEHTTYNLCFTGRY